MLELGSCGQYGQNKTQTQTQIHQILLSIFWERAEYCFESTASEEPTSEAKTCFRERSPREGKSKTIPFGYKNSFATPLLYMGQEAHFLGRSPKGSLLKGSFYKRVRIELAVPLPVPTPRPTLHPPHTLPLFRHFPQETTPPPTPLNSIPSPSSRDSNMCSHPFAKTTSNKNWPLWGHAKGAAKASCGETVVQKGVFGESVSCLPP